MQDESALERAISMVADLRARCDWDRIQTRETLRPYLIEEAHELSAALGSGDARAIRDETGDLMLHLAWQLVLGAELGEFTPDDIADDLVAKMRRRHPHLFDLGPAEEWQTLKRRERGTESVTAGLPRTLPALLMAYRVQERVATVGFDWPDTTGPIDKVREELAEVADELQAPDGAHERIKEEVGDLLFAVVNLARKAGVSPENALDAANRKFVRRFTALEQLARERDVDVATAGLARLDELWDEVKAAK